MICAVLLKCCLFFCIAGAIPLTNDEINTAKLIENANHRMANPSIIRSIDNPPIQENPLAHKIFNVPKLTNVQSNYRGGENTQIYAPKRFAEPDLYNRELELQRNQQKPGRIELNGFETVYSQNPYQNINTNNWKLPQEQDTNFYRQQSINGQTYNPEYTQKTFEPPSNLSQLYQGSSHLQKLLTNPNIIRNIFSARQHTKQYTVVYPNGTIGYEDNLESIASRYPNYVVVSYNDLEKLSNIKSDNVFSANTESQQNLRNYVSSAPDIPKIVNPSSFPLKNVVSNLPKTESVSLNDKNPIDSLEKTNEPVTELSELDLENDSQNDSTKLDTKANNNPISTNTNTTNMEKNINGINNTDIENSSIDIAGSKNLIDILDKAERSQEHFEESSKHLENEMLKNTKSEANIEDDNITIRNNNTINMEQNINGANVNNAQNFSTDIPGNSKRNYSIHNNRKTYENITEWSKFLENALVKESTKPNTGTEIFDKSVTDTINMNQDKTEIIDKSVTDTNATNMNQDKIGENDTDIQYTSTDLPEDLNINDSLNKHKIIQEPLTGLEMHPENDFHKDDKRSDIKTDITDKIPTVPKTNTTNIEPILNFRSDTDIRHTSTDMSDNTNDNLHKNEMTNGAPNQDANQSLTEANYKTSEVIYGNEVNKNDTYTFTDTEFANNDYFNDSLEENQADNWDSCEQYDDIDEDKIINNDDQSPDTKSSEKQSATWWKPNEKEMKKLLSNATFIFYAPAETIHKDTKTVIYPNGTIVEIYTETTRNSDGGPTVTITKTTTYNAGSDATDNNNNNNTSVSR